MYFTGNTWHFRFKFPNPAKQGSNSPPLGHRRPSSARGLPRGRGSVQASNQSGHHYIVVDCLNLPEKQNKTKQKKIGQLTFSWVLCFTSFVSYSQFPVLYSITVFFSVSTSLFCESNKYVDYWHDKPNKPTNKKRNKEKTQPNVWLFNSLSVR